MAAENAGIQEGDTIAVWGCGPVGPHRLELAQTFGARIINFEETHVGEALMEMTAGIGPDAVIDAVGMEAHGFAVDNVVDAVKQKIGVGADRGHALRQALLAVRKGGRVSIPGVYGGILDKWPLGAMMEKGLEIRGGQTHVQKYSADLLRRIEAGEIDTTFLISHRLPLEEAPNGYKNFRDNQNEWTKVVLKAH
jgi:threonine dehydrogenase-like Zn-dependent dehydrogenase